MAALAFAIPLLLVLVGLEAWIVTKRGGSYPLNVSISNMSCGVLDQIISVATGVVFFIVYDGMQRRFALFHPTNTWAWGIFTFVLVDLAYYAFHRASHRVAFLWGGHIVHHQSEEYNLTVSLRQGAVATWFSYPFYLSLAVVGIPSTMWVTVFAVYNLYQFFVHTALVENMGFLEQILATPRLHRLHHARNHPYIDCNYSGFFIFWDKLFGSYQPFTVEPLYGVTESIRSWSPVWSNTHYFASLWKKGLSWSSGDRIRVFLKPPGWLPASVVAKAKPLYVRYDSRPYPQFRHAGIVLFALSSLLTIVFLTVADDAPGWIRVLAGATAIAAALISTRFFDAGWTKGDSRSGAPVR